MSKQAAFSMASETARSCSGAIETVADLTAADRRQLWRLMDAHYVGLEPAEFDRDLAEKEWVITLRRANGELVGFSTQTLLPVAGHPACLALFSGDTVVAAAYRRSTALAGLWGVLALRLADAHPGRRLYWFLISKGYKTYRYLPMFFRAYHPRAGQTAAAETGAILDALGRARFGTRYDPVRRIVVAQEDGCRLRPDVAPIDTARLDDPHVRFFVHANPGHARGDELCCLAPLDRDNFTPAAWRVIHAAAATVPS
jgi:hypothetical protein